MEMAIWDKGGACVGAWCGSGRKIFFLRNFGIRR